jgi:phosphatidylglycerophosphate synthase
MLPWDQRIARIAVRPLARTPIRPNHVTTLTLALAVAGAVLIATGERAMVNWGVGIFVLARFLDHFDGELARLQGTSSSFGYYYDYVAGGIGYTALFIGLGLGHAGGALGSWALVLGAAGAIAALASLFLNLGIDKQSGGDESGEAIGYPGFAGFELEDGIYLIAPITWIGWLQPFFVLAGTGAAIYCLWTAWTYLRRVKRT